jgi:hypothetical protein
MLIREQEGEEIETHPTGDDGRDEELEEQSV